MAEKAVLSCGETGPGLRDAIRTGVELGEETFIVFIRESMSSYAHQLAYLQFEFTSKKERS